MKYLLLPAAIAALVLLSTACTRKDETAECLGSCTTIAGRVVTANSKVPLSGANVDVKWVYGSAYQPKAKTKATTTTDADGRYKVSFLINDDELKDGFFEVFYSVDKSRYYTIGENGVAFYKLGRDTVVQVSDYNIPRKAHVLLAITNQQEFLSAKSAGGQFLSNFNTCYGFNTVFSKLIQGGGEAISWEGMPTENPLSVAGDQPILVRSYKIKNGVTTYNTDSIFVAAGTTQPYTVTY